MQKSQQKAAVTFLNGRAEISVYSGNLSGETLTQSTIKIVSAFPQMKPEAIKVLHERFKEKGFSDKRVIDSVNNVIDTCRYPTPMIADFLGYDKSIEFLDHSGYLNLQDFERPYYIGVDIGLSKPVFARKSDVEMYNLMLWKK